MKDFLNGAFEYVAPTLAGHQATQKQAIRGLRALVEMPFLDIKDKAVILSELNQIIEDLESGKDLDFRAKLQFEKLVRNANFQLGDNKPYSEQGETPLALGLRIAEAAYAKSMGYNEKVRFLLPAFLPKMPPDQREEEQIIEDTAHYLELKNYLIPNEQFIEEYTHDGKLYHGTSSEAGICVLRGGFILSTPRQGAAAKGSGVYTTPDFDVAAGYANEGMVLPLTLSQGEKRIINWDLMPEQLKKDLELEASREGYFHVFDMLRDRDKYAIDIIVSEYVLIQNQAAIELDKSLESMLEWILSPVLLLNKEFAENPNDGIESKLFAALEKYNTYYQLFKIIGVDVSAKPNPYAMFETMIADILIENNEFETALNLAIKFGHEKVVERLVLIPEVVDLCNEEENRILFDVLERKNGAIVKIILDVIKDINVPDNYGKTPLMSAIESGNKELVELCLEKGADKSLQEDDGTTALMYAVQGKNKEIIELMLGNPEELITIKDKKGENALIKSLDSKDMVKYLISKVDDLQGLIKQGMIDPLYNIDFTEKKKLDKKILSLCWHYVSYKKLYSALKEQDIDLQDLKTPEHILNELLFPMLSMEMKKSTVEELLVLAVRENLPENFIKHLLFMQNIDDDALLKGVFEAIRNDRFDMAHLFVDNASDFSTGYWNHSFLNNILNANQTVGLDLIRKLISKGVMANGADVEGYTPLMKAAEMGNEELIRLLIQHGANVDAVSDDGVTALNRAANAKIRELLLSFKNPAPAQAVNSQPESPPSASRAQPLLFNTVSVHHQDSVSVQNKKVIDASETLAMGLREIANDLHFMRDSREAQAVSAQISLVADAIEQEEDLNSIQSVVQGLKNDIVKLTQLHLAAATSSPDVDGSKINNDIGKLYNQFRETTQSLEEIPSLGIEPSNNKLSIR